jgi:hypothetical protein
MTNVEIGHARATRSRAGRPVITVQHGRRNSSTRDGWGDNNYRAPLRAGRGARRNFKLLLGVAIGQKQKEESGMRTFLIAALFAIVPSIGPANAADGCGPGLPYYVRWCMRRRRLGDRRPHMERVPCRGSSPSSVW